MQKLEYFSILRHRIVSILKDIQYSILADAHQKFIEVFYRNVEKNESKINTIEWH